MINFGVVYSIALFASSIDFKTILGVFVVQFYIVACGLWHEVLSHHREPVPWREAGNSSLWPDK